MFFAIDFGIVSGTIQLLLAYADWVADLAWPIGGSLLMFFVVRYVVREFLI